MPMDEPLIFNSTQAAMTLAPSMKRWRCIHIPTGFAPKAIMAPITSRGINISRNRMHSTGTDSVEATGASRNRRSRMLGYADITMLDATAAHMNTAIRRIRKPRAARGDGLE